MYCFNGQCWFKTLTHNMTILMGLEWTTLFERIWVTITIFRYLPRNCRLIVYTGTPFSQFRGQTGIIIYHFNDDFFITSSRRLLFQIVLFMISILMLYLLVERCFTVNLLHQRQETVQSGLFMQPFACTSDRMNSGNVWGGNTNKQGETSATATTAVCVMDGKCRVTKTFRHT